MLVRTSTKYPARFADYPDWERLSGFAKDRRSLISQMEHNRMKSVRHGVWVRGKYGRPDLKAFRCPTYGCCG